MGEHTAANFDPQDYSIIEYIDNRPPPPPNPFWLANMSDEARAQLYADHARMVQQWRDRNRELFGDEWGRKIHECYHCGHAGHVRYIAVVEHIPTGEIIPFGHQCAERLHFPDKAAFRLQYIMDAAGRQAAHERNVQARQAFEASEPGKAFMAALNEYTSLSRPFEFLTDIHRRFSGTLDVPSDRQIESFCRCIDKAQKAQAEYEARKKAEREAEANRPKTPCMEGRIEITGTVLMVKQYDKARHHYYDTDYVYKALILDDRGFKVFGTAPNCEGAMVEGRETIDIPERGERVQFRATVTKSKDDECFGYYKRPLKGKILPKEKGAAK